MLGDGGDSVPRDQGLVVQDDGLTVLGVVDIGQDADDELTRQGGDGDTDSCVDGLEPAGESHVRTP